MKRISTLFVFLIATFSIRTLTRAFRLKGALLASAMLLPWMVQAQTQATNIVFQAVPGSTTSMGINWTNGTGTAGRIVVVKSLNASFTPVTANITSLNAALTYSNGASNDQDATAEVAAVVYAGTGNGPINVSGLSSGTSYIVQVYEFTGTTVAPVYILTSHTNNPVRLNFYTSTAVFTVPAGVNSVFVQAWGGGAGGGQGASGNAGSGGGGGAFSSGTVPVTFGSNPTVTVGTGGGAGNDSSPGAAGNPTSFGAAIVAPGGNVNNAGAVAAGGTGGTGSVIAGGNGGAGDVTAGRGGGGGGSSGSTGTVANGVSAGGTATGGAGGNGTDGDGGKGGDNGTANAVAGQFPGGGGGGRGDAGGTGGAGAGGLVIVSFPVPPSITSATLNYGTGVLVVTLSDGVSSLNNVDATKFHINNTTGVNLINLSEAEETSFTGNTITFTLTEVNRLAAIAVSGTIGGDGGAVVLDVEAGGVTTTTSSLTDNNNTVTETADTTKPTVVSATLNYGTGVLVVTLSEALKDINGIDATKFHINDATGTDNVNLTNAERTSINQANKTITFTLTEANRLAALALSGVTGGNGGAVVLDVDAAGVTDAATNTNNIDDNNAVTETADTVAPSVASAVIDYNTGILVVTLTEGVANTAAVDGTKFHINNISGTDLINLTNGEVTSVNTGARTVTFTLTEVHRIAAIAISGTTGGDGGAVKLDVDAGGLTDPRSNSNAADIDNTTPTETADTTKPTVTSATLDYGTGILVVTLSEGLKDINGLNGALFHLNDATGTDNVTLSNAERTSVDQANKTATFTLSNANRLAALALSGVAGGNGGAVVLDVDAAGVTDAATNTNNIDDNNAVTEAADTTAPTILSATINYGTGVMVVTLSEGVANTAAVDGTKFHINNTTGTDLITLSAGEVTSVNTGAATVTFTLTEVHRIAAIAISGTAGGDGGAAKLDADIGALTDPQANSNAAAIDNTTLTETADSVVPTVASATLNYGTGVLVVTLSEGVKDINALDGTKFHLNDATGTDNVTLSNAERTSIDQATKTVTFTLTEANRGAALLLSGTTGGNGGAVVLDVDAAGVTDAANNTNAIDDNNAVTESADVVAPTVTSATLNYGTGVLVVTFSEGIPLASVDATKFHINNTTGTDVVTLSAGEKTSANTGARTVTFTLTEANRLAALAISGVTGGDGGAVVLDVDASGIADIAGNALAANDDNNTVTESPDTVAPSVASAAINYGTGVLVVTLTEGVANTAAVIASGFHINNTTGTDNVTLTNGELTSVNTAARTVTFTLTEANRVAALAISGTAGGDGGAVKLDVDATALADPRGNANASDIDNTTPTETGDSVVPVASAPTSVAQRLKTGATSTSTVASNESASIIYLVKNGVAAGTTGQISTAIGANNAFQVQANANKDQAYTVTIPGSINDGTYDIVVVDKAGNVSAIVGGWLYVDNTVPTVAITRQTATPTNLTTLNFNVTFDEAVTGVDLTDFLLQTGNLNDATGTLSITPNSASSYTIQVSSVVGQNAGNFLSVLNLDLAGSTGIVDVAGNAFTGTFTEEEYEVDNTPPALSPDQMLLKDNGGAVETITFNLSEELNVAEGASVISGFSTSSGAIASAIYTGKGTTNKVTLTSAANGQWTTATTVSYSGAGAFTDLIGNLLPNITNHVVIQPVVNLVAGDIAFTTVRSDDTDQFSVVLLRSVPAGTQIYFTDRGWNSTGTPAIEDFSDDGLFIWTASAAYSAGTEIKFLSNGSNVFTSSLGSVANDAEKVAISASGGDEILAYQTDGSTITFIAAIKFADNQDWEADGNPDGGSESAVPAGLTASHYLLLGDRDNGAYRRTATATTFTGSTTELRALINNVANWDVDDDPNQVDLPGDAAPNDGTAWAAFSPSSITYVVRPKINSVSIPNVAMKVGSTVTATINVDDDAALTPVSLTSGTIGGFTLGSFNRTNATTYTAQFTVAEGGTNVAAGSDVPVASLVLQNSLGNSNSAFAANVNPAGNADAIDAKSPTVASLVRQTSTTTQFGTSATSVVFRMSFVSAGTSTPEDIQIATLTAADFSIPVTGSVTGAAVTGVAAVSTGVYDITVGNYSGTGTLGLNYRDSEVNALGASVLDLAGNTTITSAGVPDGSFTGEVYSIVLPEPGAGVSPISVSIGAFTSNSVTVQWPSDAITPLPTHYLVLARLTSAGAPVTGTDVADFTFISDGAMAQNVARIAGTHSHTFNGLSSGTSYSFYVYKYALSPNNASNHIDFQYSNFGQVTQVTSTAQLSWVQSTAAPVTIGSIMNTSGSSASVLQFKILDDGLDPLVPNIVSLNPNGLGAETMVLTLRDELTLAEGASVTGFSSSTGSVVSAIYTGKGTTNTITLTNGGANNTWTAATTLSYSAVAGNLQFVTLGRVQSIQNHTVTPVADVVVSYSASGTYNFTVPAGVTQLTVETWGAGGSGGPAVNNATFGGGTSGGGGGAYSRRTISVVPGSVHPLTVGNGGPGILGTASYVQAGNDGQGTSFGSPTTVYAEGGQGGWNNDWTDYYGINIHAFTSTRHGLGGQAANGIGDVRFSGGDGGYGYDGGAMGGVHNAGVFGSGGGGGSSAGTSGNGSDGANGILCVFCTSAGGSAPTGGGAGGAGQDGGAGFTGNIPGGGGGGTSRFGPFISGGGADGRVVITYPGSHPTSGGTKDWAADNAPFKFSQVVISQGTTGNSPALVNWQNIILGAELSDGTPNPPVAGTINPTNITFSSIPTGVGDVGYIDDAVASASSKTYAVKVWLRTDLSNTLAATVDGLSLAFSLDPADIVYDDAGSQSSRLVAPYPTFETGANTINVVADRLVYRTPGTTAPTNTNPQPQIGVGIPFSASSAQDPEVYALDANNNLDLDFDKLSANITISNSGSFGQAITAPQFIDGKLTLNGFRFTTGSTSLVNTQIVVATTGTPTVTSATSTDVAPFISSLTTIAAGPTAEAALIPSTTTSLTVSTPQNFDFVLTDDVGANTTTFADNDALPTILTNVSITQHTDNGAVSGGGDPAFDLWLRSIAGAELSRTGSPTTVLATVTNTSLDFDLTTLTPAQIANFATITDGGTATFKLRVWLNGPVDPSLRTIIDGLDLVFNVDNTGLQVASGSASSFVATGNLNSGNDNNQIEVDATQLMFAQDFSGALSLSTIPPAANADIDYLVNTSATTLGYSNPIVEAVDVNGLRDADYTAAVTTSNADALGMSNQLTTVTAGIGTFSGGFLYTGIGDGTLAVSTAVGNRTGFVPAATTNGQVVNVRTGNATTFDVASTVVSSPIASIVNAAPGFTVLKFRVDDDPAGTPVSENDGNPTLITTVTISNTSANNTIVDWREAIAGARLEDAGNATKFVDLIPSSQIGANTLTFTGISTAAGELGFIADNATKEYNLRIWLKTSLVGTQNYNRIIDGLKFGFNVLSTNVGTNVNGTSFTLALQQPNAANGASTVAVTATQIDIVNPVMPTVPPGPASASLEVPMQVQLEARDVNANLDLDFSSTITSITNNSGATMQSPKGVNINTGGSDITFGVTAFSGGLYNLPYTTLPSLNGFQFTTGNDNDDVSLDITAGGINTLTTFGPKYPEIRLRSSFESVLAVDPAFVPVLDIPYHLNQDITTAATSFAIAQFKLTDGNGVTPDVDGAATNVDDLTLSVTTASTHNIRALAVYKGTTLVQSKNNAAFSAGSVTFDNLFNDLVAPDGGSVVFTIRASFFDTPAAVTDNDPIKLAVTAVTQAGGSQFLGTSPTTPLPGFIGGVNGGAQGATHQIEVLATRLDFTTDPLVYEGINQPLGSTPVVQARDVNGVVDLDQHNVDGFISSAVGINNNRFTFSNGILTLTGFQYTSPGIGTLVATSTNAVGGALSSTTGGSNAGDPVDVIHVTANISSPQLTPQLIDLGFGDPTNPNILVSQGSSAAELYGQTYAFASTRPPQLISSSPFNGQLNVDPALGQIDLVFDVDVLTFDGKAELYDRKYNKLIATLPAMNGVYNGNIADISSQTVTPLSFKIPTGVVLKPDSLYYLKIAQGSYDPATNQGTGISDEGQNFYGGISYNGTLYFKISSPVPPKMMSTDANKYFASNSAGVFNASFDQFGKAYYLVLDHATAVATPTNANILTPATYPQFATAYVTHGSFDIQQVSPSLQSVPFSASLTPGATYDVWIFAQNDAQPTPFATAAPYGGTSPFTPGSAGPTLKIVVPAVVSGSNKPIIQICPNSEVIVTDPIIIGETAASDFNGGAQNFNLLLPTGFSFDVDHSPTVTLAGGNFVGGATVSFVNNTILNVAFTNIGTGSFDNIIISDFKIFASSSGSIASITRFAGSGLSTVPDGTVLATLFAKPVEIQEFTNTYTTGNNFSGVGLGGRVINVIPDNFNSPAAVVRLIPTIQPATDFGPSFFSGPGVTNDLLNLTGVALNTAFDVTMTHTDLNGCISNKVEQYLVYDHTAAIPVLGTDACVTNVNFPTGDSPALSSPTLNFNAKAGYFLVELFANIPSKATASSQIMFGADWQAQVAKIPKVVATNGDYKSYRWDYSHILNAVTETNGAISVNPYNHDIFADTTLNNNPYWKGGSLGLVEFTGRYRNNADLSVEVPFRQEVEIFVPPIPLIEVGQASANAGNTPIFCQNQIGDVIINGFPLATAGVSTGFFVLRDSATNSIIYNAATKPAGFKDNSNGTANLTPSLLFNNYRTIRVEYTYQDDNSPCSGTGVFYLRIAPNPVAAITKSSAITANTPLGTEFCEGILVNFDGAGSTIATGQIAEYIWNFGDATGSSGTNPNTATGQKSSHRYNTAANYAPTLTVRSSFGCASLPQPTAVNVGSIPTPEFVFEGVSTADQILFTNRSTFTSPNDNFARLIWSFDFANTGGPNQTVTTGFGAALPHNYTTAGVYTVNLDVTSVIGCTSNVSHNIIVLPRKTPTDLSAYTENFETTDGGWQTGTLGTTPSSWASGALNKAAIALDANNGSRAWATGLTGFYNGRERSALYTPSFDLSSLERPMISFDHFTHLAAGEGVAVEYSTDNKNVADPTKNWAVLGVVNSGVFWYNANGLSSQPGQKNVQGFGWSSEDTKWTESKHVLDAVLGQSKVVFRFALSTLTDVPAKDGFAVDNVRVGNRTRTVLVENFKNLGNNAGNPIIEKTESALLKDFKQGAIGTKLVKMNYHVGFPQQDPFNLDNPQDPSSRALYYNVKATPVVKMDGEGEGGLFSAWGENKYDVQTLKLANARIDIGVSTNMNGSVNADVTVTSVAKTLLAQSTILQVAIVEKSIALNSLPGALQGLVKTQEDAFEFVVKKMLPSAAGTRLPQTLADGQSQTFTGFTWTPDRTRLYSTDNLAVVAFIQDEATREVFQAEIKDLGTDPPAVTGLEDGLRIEDVILHPNPADNEVTVRLPRNAVADVDIQMIDQAGRTLQNATLPKGERAVTLNVRDLPSSVYLLKLTENGRVTYKRAMVVHRN